MKSLSTWWRLRQLASNDARVRLAALKKLGQQKKSSCIPAVAGMLGDEERAVRAAAVQALGEIGTPAAVEPLIKTLLEERYWDLRYDAVESLRKIGDPTAVNELLLVLESSNRDVSVQQMTAWALKEFGWEHLAPAQRAMVSIFRDEWDDVVAVGGPAVEPLVVAFRSGTLHTRRLAAEALGKIGDARAVGALEDLLDDSDPDIRASAAWSLEKYAWNRLDEQLLARVQIMLGKWTMLAGAGPAAITPLVEVVRNGDRSAKAEAIQTIAIIGGPEGVRALIGVFKHRDEHVRRAAAKALGEIADNKAMPALVKALRDDDFQVRIAAADALVRLDFQPESAEERALLFVATRKWTEAARLGPNAIEPLVAALKNGNTRTQAMEALISIGSQALPTLIEMLDDDGPGMRISAAEALGDIGDEQAIPPLLEAFKNGDLNLRRAAFNSLEQLGWKPQPQQRAEIAVALEEWWQLPEMGADAIGLLLRLIGESKHANQALHAVEQMLQSDIIDQLPVDALRRLAGLVQVGKAPGKGHGPGSGAALQAAVARRRVGQLARKELQKRGVPMIK